MEEKGGFYGVLLFTAIVLFVVGIAVFLIKTTDGGLEFGKTMDEYELR